MCSQVKIKRKQHLVRKEIEPVFSEEDRKNGPQTDGGSSLCLSNPRLIVELLLNGIG